MSEQDTTSTLKEQATQAFKKHSFELSMAILMTFAGSMLGITYELAEEHSNFNPQATSKKFEKSSLTSESNIYLRGASQGAAAGLTLGLILAAANIRRTNKTGKNPENHGLHGFLPPKPFN